MFGKSPWLDSVMGITDYGHRGVPNVFLNAPLQSKGVWNAAHFKNPTYDGLVKEYTAALDIDAQRRRRRRSRSCCSTRRRSSTPTSTTS